MPQPQLTVVDGRSVDYVTLPRYRVVEASMEAQSIAVELDRSLARLYALVWANKRTRGLLAIGELQASLASLRRTFHDLAGLAEDLPAEPPSERPGPRRAPGRRRSDRVVATPRAA